MVSLPQQRSDVSPSVMAALLLFAQTRLRRLDLSHPTVAQILDATGASRSRAYELKNAILSLLSDLVRPVGRPHASPPSLPSADAATLSQQALHFVADHPGAICGGEKRRRYSDAFRCFVLELCEQHGELELAAISEAICLPLGTLKDWLRGGYKETDAPSKTAQKTDPATSSRIETIIEQWRRWEGSFSAFCDHISFNLRIPYGRTFISSILEQHGERIPRRRSGRSPDEKALRNSFETFFPGAQWEGDGTPVEVQIGDERFSFNLELMVDAHSAASVGISIRDEEDSEAVIATFDDGVQTTGEPPLSVLLDNRPSNHTEKVDEGLGDAIRMRSTKGRPQNKAHVEGAFGLFFQVVPLLVIATSSSKELARQILKLVVQTWARTLNHKPRKSRKGRSRVEIYNTEAPTSKQVEQAKAALEERRSQQEQARETLRARQDPVVRSILDDAFARLALDDPQGNLRSAIARYPLSAVVNGIATFEGRRHAGTLPDGVDGRYLLGIVRNISQQDEGIAITEALLRARLDARDRLLTPLRKALESTLQAIESPTDTLKVLTDIALKADRQLDHLFWLGAIVDHILEQPDSSHTALLRFVSRRIHATFAIDYRDRQVAVRFICSRVIPLR